MFHGQIYTLDFGTYQASLFLYMIKFVYQICIHVIFSWTQIGRFGFTDREIGSQMGRFFRSKKYSILVSKIVICSTVDHCKMFYLPAYC